MSGMLAPLGIVSGAIAAELGQPVTEVTARYSWLTFGIWIGAVAALIVFRWLGVRLLMLALYALIALCLLTLFWDRSADALALRLGIIGVCCGIGLPAAAFTIASTYSDARRASMLVITDGFFSIAGMVCGWLAVAALAQGYEWPWAFALVGVVALLVCLLSLLSVYPEHGVPESAALVNSSQPESRVAPSLGWPLPIWLFIGALALYTLSQSAILMWLPQYAQSRHGLSATVAGNLVSQYWLGMFAAQLFVAWFVLRVGTRRLLWAAAFCSLLFSLPLLVASGATTLTVWVTLWGFGNLGLLKLAISHATELVPAASPTLVSMLLLGATSGTAISPMLSSFVVERAGGVCPCAWQRKLRLDAAADSLRPVPSRARSERHPAYPRGSLMEVGTVDLACASAGGDFYRTLRETGFAVIVGHDIPETLIAELHACWQAFFDGEDKHRYRNQGDDQWGYWPAEVSETAIGAQHRDLKEFFQLGPTTPLPVSTAETVAEYQRRVWPLGRTLLSWLEQTLPEGVLAASAWGLANRLSEAESLLRIVHYPPLTAVGGNGLRAAAHEDINLITILPVAEEPGLQVLDQRGRWHAVHGSRGHLIVNAGDMLAEATDGFIRSTTHRVANPEDVEARRRSRIAAPLFLAPQPDTVLSERYTAGSYLAERLSLIGLTAPAAPTEPPP